MKARSGLPRGRRHQSRIKVREISSENLEEKKLLESLSRIAEKVCFFTQEIHKSCWKRAQVTLEDFYVKTKSLRLQLQVYAELCSTLRKLRANVAEEASPRTAF